MSAEGFLTGRARVAGIMGHPVDHSLSPRLHGYWLRRHGLDGAYVPLPVHPENLERALRALPALGFRGCNLTIPHKQAALAVVDEVSSRAARIGAINTIVVEGERLLGENTDVLGFAQNLEQSAPGWRAAAGPAVVLGSGGGARAVLVALIDGGAPEIRLLNRSADRAQALAREFAGPIEVLDWDTRANALEGAATLVNTTSLGMVGQPPLELDLAALPAHAVVADIVYTPLETGLLATARARGNPVVDGLGMLLHQGRPAFAAWFGVTPEVTPELREVMLAALAR